jgi:hypothetical protein
MTLYTTDRAALDASVAEYHRLGLTDSLALWLTDNRVVRVLDPVLVKRAIWQAIPASLRTVGIWENLDAITTRFIEALRQP